MPRSRVYSARPVTISWARTAAAGWPTTSRRGIGRSGGEAPLERPHLGKRPLQRVEHAFQGQALKRNDLSTIGLSGKHQTRVDGLPIEHNDARPAIALTATFLDARHPQILAQDPEEALSRLRAQLHGGPVERDTDRDLRHAPPPRPDREPGGREPPPSGCDRRQW